MNSKLKNNLFYFSVIILCLLTALFLGKFFSNVSKKANAVAQFGNKTIIIDAGHGGEDGGAVALDGTLEKDINLKIAKKLNSLFSEAGFSTVMTRSEDKAIYKETNEKKTLRRKKLEDLKNRLSMANSNENNVFISIHQNKFTDPGYSGTQIFYSSLEEDSEYLARCIKESIKEKLQPDNKRENKKAGKEIFLLSNIKVPAVIVECGFLSNVEECRKLNTEEYQKDIALCIFEGVKKFLSEKKVDN